MIKTLKYILAACVLTALAACNSDENTAVKGLRVSSEELTFLQTNPSEMVLNVSSDSDWSVVAPSWVTVEPVSGSAGSTKVKVSVPSNDGEPFRYGNMVFKSRTASAVVAVSQLGVEPLPEQISVYRFLALDDDDTSTYTLQGLVREILPDESFFLVDETGSVSVSGLYDGGEKVLGKYFIADGDTLVLTGKRLWDGHTVSVEGASYVSHRSSLVSGSVPASIAGLSKLADYTPVTLRAQVCWADHNGAILTADDAFVFAEGDASGIAPGQTVVVDGKKKKSYYQRILHPVFTVLSDGSYTKPSAVKYTQYNIDSYNSLTYQFSSIDGTLALSGDGVAELDPGEVALTKCSLVYDGDLSKLDGAYVRVQGYPIEKKGKVLTVFAESVREVGESDGDPILVVEWPLGTSAARSGYNSSWSKRGEILADNGSIVFDHSGSLAAGTLSSNNNAMDAPTSTSAFSRYSPRAYGTFEGDNFTFTGFAAMAPGEKAEIYFQLAETVNCMKYWYMEYLDGDDWRPVGDVRVMDFQGRDVKYTHTIEVEKQVNVFNEKVTYLHDTPQIIFRFTIVSSIAISGRTRYPVGTAGVDEADQGTSGWMQIFSKAQNYYGSGQDYVGQEPHINKYEVN